MSPMEVLMEQVDWKPTGESGEGLYATHEGTIHLGGQELKVYQLNDGRRVIDGNDAANLLGIEWEALVALANG